MLVDNICIFGGHSFLMKRRCGRQGKLEIYSMVGTKQEGVVGGDKRGEMSGGSRLLHWVTWKDLSYERALPNLTTEHA